MSLGLASPASGATLYLTIDRSDDPAVSGVGGCLDGTPNDCSLRQAVTDANANLGFDAIYFASDLSGSVLTTSGGGQIEISDAVGIYGYGADITSISAAPDSRIFDLNTGTVSGGSGDVVALAGLQLTGGDVSGDGGAILNRDAKLSVFDSLLSGNTADGVGGAVFAADSYEHGHANSFFYSTFANNTATSGGAIYGPTEFGVINDSTFSGNTATSGAGGAISGQGFISNSTVAGNHAPNGSGGGVDGAPIQLYNTIVANNTAGTQADIGSSNAYGTHDLIEDPGTSTITGDQMIFGQDPQLSGLAMNGGYTPTLKPASTSPVIDAGTTPIRGFDPVYDQRGPGFDRLVDNPQRANVSGGDGTDVGAVELTLAEGPQPVPQSVPQAPFVAPPPAFNLKAAIRKCRKKFPKGPRRKKCIKKAKSHAR